MNSSDGYPYYFQLVGSKSCPELYSSSATFKFLKTIDEEPSKYRYANNKWSIKQVVGHIADHERIKMYRALLLSRNQAVKLWGYDQNALVENSRFNELPFARLIEDFENVRKASFSFLNGLSESQLKINGMANEFEITLEDFLKSIIGHEIHHINCIKQKYI